MWWVEDQAVFYWKPFSFSETKQRFCTFLKMQIKLTFILRRYNGFRYLSSWISILCDLPLSITSGMTLLFLMQLTKTSSREKIPGTVPGSRRAGTKWCTTQVRPHGGSLTVLFQTRLGSVKELWDYRWSILDALWAWRTLQLCLCITLLSPSAPQFLLFSTWTPGSWSQPRPPRCSEVRHHVCADAQQGPF